MTVFLHLNVHIFRYNIFMALLSLRPLQGYFNPNSCILYACVILALLQLFLLNSPRKTCRLLIVDGIIPNPLFLNFITPIFGQKVNDRQIKLWSPFNIQLGQLISLESVGTCRWIHSVRRLINFQIRLLVQSVHVYVNICLTSFTGAYYFK